MQIAKCCWTSCANSFYHLPCFVRCPKQNLAQSCLGGKQALPQACSGFQGLQPWEAQPGILDPVCPFGQHFPCPNQLPVNACLQSSVFSPLPHSHLREPLIPCGVHSGSHFWTLQFEQLSTVCAGWVACVLGVGWSEHRCLRMEQDQRGNGPHLQLTRFPVPFTTVLFHS